ncbi:MAG TPA: hypothetical protein VK304_08110 [Thermoleophilaceae bacterium]|nr:hypothetical protein [Thermoleophilaceae bacterium]
MRRAAALLACSLLAACGDGERQAAPPAPPQRPAVGLCGELGARMTGRVDTPAATELSGLVVSHTRPGVLWAHNDSGDSARLLELGEDGHLRREVAVPGAENVDWEDVAARGDLIYVGDIGDNDSERPTITIVRVRESGAPAGRQELRYADGPHDAETLLVDPLDGSVAVVTKSFGGENRLYVAREGTLRRGPLVPVTPGEAVTAGDVSADGHTVVLRTYDRALVWTRRKGERLTQALRRKPCAAGVDLAREGQGEALALAENGRSFFTVAEGTRPPLRRYAPVR